MGRKLDFSAPTNAVLSLPQGLAEGIILSDLSAPAMRATLVLIAAAKADGSINLLKPDLEMIAAVRIDNGHRFLDALTESCLDMPADQEHVSYGDAVFKSLDYQPGEQKRFAGIIRGQLSDSFRGAVSEPRWQGRIEIDLDVLRRLTTVPGILMYLKIAGMLARNPSQSVHRMRLKINDAMALFCNYGGQAATKTRNAAGEFSLNISLGRIHRHLITPALIDLGNALEDFDVDAVVAMPENPAPGRAWSHIDIMVRRLIRLGTLSDLNERQRQRGAYKISLKKADA
jgi:hypothetical protein